MRQVDGYFKGTDNYNLYWRGWLPDGKPRAVILLVPGLAEHISRYDNLVSHLVSDNFAVYGIDHQGHGRSEGQRGFVKRFQVYLDDLKTFDDKIRRDNPGLKTIMMGHSMGGLIATAYAVDHQQELAGLVASAPMLKAGESISAAAITLARILSVVAPRMGVQAIDSTYLSRDKDVVRAYDNDPLVYRGKITARLGSEMFAAMESVQKKLSQLTIPVIVMQGSDDKLVSHEGSRLLYDKASSTDKTIKIYEGFYHEIFNEPERARVFADLDAWLDRHV